MGDSSNSFKLALEFDLNEAPPSPPNEPVVMICGSCRQMGSGDLIMCCCVCGSGFHLKCLGAKEKQADWKCFKCLLKVLTQKARSSTSASAAVSGGGGSSSGGGMGLFDINAPPPQEIDDEGEGFVTGPAMALARNMQSSQRDGFVESTFNANRRYVGASSEFQKASCSVTPFPNSAFELPMQRRLNSDREAVLGYPNGKSQGSDCAPVNYQNYISSQVYLQDLRDNLSTLGGLLGEGWHVEFGFCNSNRKSFPVYCAPDGSKFDSKEKVAYHLGLLSNWRSSEVEDINKTGFLEKAIHTDKRTKLRSRGSPGNEIINFQGSHDSVSRVAIDLNPLSNGSCVSEKFLDDFPVQFEDFFVMSIGKIDPRPSFHTACEIWPIGYRSIWHDRFTGSLFVSQVLDRGDSSPVFRVRRLPCAKQSIPNASTVIWRSTVGLNDGRVELPSDDSAIPGLVGDEDMSIQAMLTEISPPHLDINILSCTEMSAGPDHNFQKLNGVTTDSGLLERSPGVIPDNFGSGDVIPEFLVDGSSSSSAWEMVSKTLIDACRKVYDEKGLFRFGCKHSIDGGDSYCPESLDSLSKFCYSANPMNNVTGFILSTKELDVSCEVLSKWIRLDRFGLDMGFVQELIEQLPGVTSCSNYQFLSKRIQNLALQTVGSGVLLAKRKNDLKIEKESDCSIQSCRRPNPSGKQLSSKLPRKLIGDVLQVCDFSWRFSEVLELGAPFSLPEIEDELMNPWLDASKPLKKSPNEIEYIGNRISCNGSGANDLASGPSSVSYTNFQGEDSGEVITMEEDSSREPFRADLASNTHRRCNGAILAKSQTLLLNVVIGELLSKVAPIAKSNIDSGESKIRRGKKKDADSSVTAKKTHLDVLPMNVLTWPELARRYILAVLFMDGIDSAEDASRKVIHCLQGDGGVLCGALTGVAAMEADAVILAEASKKIFGPIRSKSDVVNIAPKEPESNSSEVANVTNDEIPEWAQALEPVRKLPTNVGARIRNCIYKALEKNPPEWAEEILKQSITKEVYRGNASGPTKRLVLSVLAKVTPEDPKVKPEKKEKARNVKTLSDVIMKQCQIMLRHAVAADKERVFCNLLGRTTGNDEKGVLGYAAMVSRPLDFRTIDIRLTAGVYGESHEAFIEDVREVWRNVRIAFREKPEFDQAETLCQKFENLYEEEVLALVHKVSEISDANRKQEDSKDDMHSILAFTSESSLPKAPWEDGVCKFCGLDKDDDSVLLCDRCDSEYHTYCLDPPLARIPDGNWYCPSCVESPPVLQDGFCGSLLLRQSRKRRVRREFTHKIVKELAHLADMMELKEYWELNLEERVFLLKYVCDEALSSSMIHDHLDHCASVSPDMRSKLRSFTSELKHLKSREDILVANSAKSRQTTCCGELGSEVLASMMSDDGKLLWRANGSSKNVSLSSTNRENGPDSGSQNQLCSLSKCSSEKPCSGSSQMQIELNGQNGLSNSNLKDSNHSSSSVPLIAPTKAIPEMSFMHENASQAYQLELKSIKNEISSLQNSIENLEAETHKTAIRKKLLGRDAAGRLYWAFSNPCTSPKVIASGSWMVRQGKETELVDPFEENTVSYSCFPNSVQNYLDANEHSSWTYYESDAEICELIGWLRDDDPREMELKECILQLRRNKLRESNNAPNHLQNIVKVGSCDHENAIRLDFPLTKARTVLEKMFGSCFDISKSQGSRGKVCSENQLYRCECLELVRPSRHHCLLCHRTFCSTEELEGHRNGKCKLVLSVPKNCQKTEGSAKGKRKILEGPPRQKNLDPRRKCKEESGVKEMNLSTPTNSQNLPDCPYNLEEIKAKFVTKNSLKEEVGEIGLIGSGGIPSFVPDMSASYIDPALLVVNPTKKNKANSSGRSTVAENLQQQLQKGENNSIHKKRVDSGMNEASKVERFKSKGTNTNSFRNKRSLLGVDKFRVICQSSLRPLVGKVTEILRQLKISLLEMDAALPEEALRPTRANSENRCLWREFVKAAASIYEMIQATIVLEDMIKTEYLRNEWWYWSSPAAAAKVSTVSALALRIYALDAAIIYEKSSKPSVNTAEAPARRSKKIDKESSPNSNSKSTPKARSPPLAVAFNLGSAETSKLKNRQNKRRRDSMG